MAQAGELRLVEGIAATLKHTAATIGGFTELLANARAGQADDPDLRRACRYLLENARALLGFAADIHDFARHEQGRLRLLEQQVDAAELIAAALGLCEAQAENADAYILAVLLEGVELRCDAARIRQAIASLAAWEMAGAEPGALIEVRLERQPDGGAAISLTLRTGTPERPGDWPFEPQPRRDGLSAFALPVARRVALLHSGDVTIEPNSHGGLTARLTLPPHRVIWPATA
jgi:signal transduction histidine kinase